MSETAPPEALLEALLRQPDSQAVRMVWADALLERGDPRGEFIVLQCTQPLTEAQRRRMTLLRRQHGASWYAGLGRLIPDGEVRFEQGVMVSCTLRRTNLQTQCSLVLQAEAGLLKRVRIARRFVPEEQPLTELLGRLPGLRILDDAGEAELFALIAAGVPLERVHLERFEADVDEVLDGIHLPTLQGFGLRADGALRAVSRFLERHPDLVELDVGQGDLARWRTALGARVPLLTVRTTSWTLKLSREARHLDAWALGGPGERPVRSLSAALWGLEIGELDFIHVRGGKLPLRDDLVELDASAQGTPLLLPARWRRVLRPR